MLNAKLLIENIVEVDPALMELTLLEENGDLFDMIVGRFKCECV